MTRSRRRNGGSQAIAEKATTTEVAALSVQDRGQQVDTGAFGPVVFWVANAADEVAEWWSEKRDQDLDRFWKTEPILAGAVYTVAAKVAAAAYKLSGPGRQVAKAQSVLAEADLGNGWVPFMFKVVQDLLTADNGAFVELMRQKGAAETTPPVGIAHLDSQRCVRTGLVEAPVYYRSARTGTTHKLEAHQVIALSDMASPREEMRGVGFCAVSRALRAAQLLRDISLYKRQKVGGKRVPGILFVKGLRRNAVEEAVKEALEQQQAEGLSHYTKPIILASPDPGLPLEAQLIAFASLPDGYDEDVVYRWYVAQVALDFGVDYGELAPLPGQGLGTAAQSEVQHEKAKGKGVGVMFQMIEHAINWGVLPASVEMEFVTDDLTAEAARAEVGYRHASTIETLVAKAGVLGASQGLQMLVDWGDVPPEFLDQDVTDEVTGTDTAPVQEPESTHPLTGEPQGSQPVSGEPGQVAEEKALKVIRQVRSRWEGGHLREARVFPAVKQATNIEGEAAEWGRTAEWMQERRRQARKRVAALTRDLGRASLAAVADIPEEEFMVDHGQP